MNVSASLKMFLISNKLVYLRNICLIYSYIFILFSASSPLEAHLILTAIKYALKGTPVQEGLIDIIQGQDEGIFSWITTNFLSKTLVQNEVCSILFTVNIMIHYQTLLRFF